MSTKLIIDIYPLTIIFNQFFPNENESEVRSCVINQVVHSHFVPKQEWATDNSSETMIQYMHNVMSVPTDQAAAAWRAMDDALLEKLISVQPDILGGQRVPTRHEIIGEHSLMLYFESA